MSRKKNIAKPIRNPLRETIFRSSRARNVLHENCEGVFDRKSVGLAKENCFLGELVVYFVSIQIYFGFTLRELPTYFFSLSPTKIFFFCVSRTGRSSSYAIQNVLLVDAGIKDREWLLLS
jgi:hypothetical protein